jgi:cysteine desulfurase
MKPYFTDNFANSSSMHSLGVEINELVENARNIILNKLNATNHKLIFTSGGTESNNLAIKGIAQSYVNKGKHILTTPIEHDSVLNTVKYLKTQGYEVEYLKVDKEGFVDLEDLKNKIRNDTIIVSIIHGNNEIGTIQDIKEIGDICSEKKTFLHIDACQSFCKTEINLEKQNIDLVTINAHKIYGPKGIGALIIKEGINLTPLLHGGGHEYNLRSGTLNVPGIIGFQECINVINKEDILYMKKIRNHLIDNILKLGNVKLLGPLENRLCNHTAFLFDKIEGDALLFNLDIRRIKVSTGSACGSNNNNENHVLKAIKANDTKQAGHIRITLGKETTFEDADKLISELVPIIKKLNEMSKR